jgi:hypothetical protein
MPRSRITLRLPERPWEYTLSLRASLPDPENYQVVPFHVLHPHPNVGIYQSRRLIRQPRKSSLTYVIPDISVPSIHQLRSLAANSQVHQ